MRSLFRSGTRRPIGIIVRVFLAVLLRTSLATAAVPRRVAYQGLLLDSNGIPVIGSVDIDVVLFDAASAGTNLWSESHLGVSVLDGVYSIELGATTPLSGAVLQSGSVFLEITIDAETLTPRQQLLAVPYALEAANLAGLSGEYFVQLFQDVSFDGGDPPNLDPSEGLADTDGDGIANFADSDNDNDGLPDTTEVAAGTDINLVTPALSSFSPSTADGFETTTVTISGMNFTPDSAVIFGSQTPAISNFSPGAFDVLVGPQFPDTGPVSVSVTRPNGETATSSFSFFYRTPTLTFFSPGVLLEGASGTITIVGTNFIPGMTVQFGSQSPTPTNITATRLDVAVGPFVAGDQTVVVTHPNGESATASFPVGIPTPGLVFVAGPISGNMGGLAGADAICQTAADAAPVFGSYKAWLSTSSESPSTRLRRDVGPYTNTQGQTLANDWDDLTDGPLAAGVRYAADGTSAVGTVWTNTDIAGDAVSTVGTCSDWTSASAGQVARTGTSNFETGSWINNGFSAGCGASYYIYCFGD